MLMDSFVQIRGALIRLFCMHGSMSDENREFVHSWFILSMAKVSRVRYLGQGLHLPTTPCAARLSPD